MEQHKLQALLRTMTLKQKAAQLVQLQGSFYAGDAADTATGPAAELGIDAAVVEAAGSILNTFGAEAVIRVQKQYLAHSPHGIPLLCMADIINGYKTIFPIPLGQGCCWNPASIGQAARIAACEAAASGLHVTFSPMVDVVRDARWGRVMESAGGEDPYLGGVYAKAIVEGYQGDLCDAQSTIAACVKHFAAYGAAEAGREYNTVDLSPRELRNTYLPPYRAAVDAGACMVMTAFNVVEGIPATGNRRLLRDLLRGEWQFDGVVISDYAAVAEILAHGAAEDEADATRKAALAGVDIDMMTGCYARNLPTLVRSGQVEMDILDSAVMRILQLKNRLGLFENPFRGADPEREKQLHLCPQHRAAARHLAAESCVLLKNDGALPLAPGQRVALVGPHAQSDLLCGMWSMLGGVPQGTVSLADGLRTRLGDRLTVAAACDILEPDEQALPAFGYRYPPPMPDAGREWQAALTAAQNADIVVLALGEHPM